MRWAARQACSADEEAAVPERLHIVRASGRIDPLHAAVRWLLKLLPMAGVLTIALHFGAVAMMRTAGLWLLFKVARGLCIHPSAIDLDPLGRAVSRARVPRTHQPSSGNPT